MKDRQREDDVRVDWSEGLSRKPLARFRFARCVWVCVCSFVSLSGCVCHGAAILAGLRRGSFLGSVCRFVGLRRSGAWFMIVVSANVPCHLVFA